MDNSKVLYAIFYILLIGVILSVLSYFSPDNSIISKLSSKIPITTGLLTATAILLTYLVFRNTYTKNLDDITLAMTDRGFLKIFDTLAENSNKCPYFIDSLKFSFQKNYNYENKNNDKDDQVAIDNISVKIFQAMEDYLATATLTSTSDSEWFGTFLSFCQSKTLKQQWDVYYFNFGKKTKLYIDELFKIAKENTFKSAKEVVDFSEKFILTKTFKDIFAYVDPTNTTQV